MRVHPDRLEGVPIVAMEADEADPDAGVVAGETLGYYCMRCQQSDETLEQIVHDESCELAGEHGRSVYGDELDVESFDHASRGELRPDTEFSILKWSKTIREGEIYNSDVAGWRCDNCANLDEHLFEIVHDDECLLSHVQEARAMADGGREA